jgi:hypothetical protein
MLGKFDDLGVWLQGIRRITRPLAEGFTGTGNE